MQKAKRYYNEGDISGLFNFESSRVYGYAANLWNSSLQMDLWIYRLFNGSIQDCANAIKRNLSTTATPDTPASVSWSAADTFTPDPVSQEYYNEARITDSGRPSDVPEPSESTEPADSPTPSASASPTTSSEPTPEPTVEPTPEPTPDPVEPAPTPDTNTETSAESA